jgi:hypothetical protein
LRPSSDELWALVCDLGCGYTTLCLRLAGWFSCASIMDLLLSIKAT